MSSRVASYLLIWVLRANCTFDFHYDVFHLLHIYLGVVCKLQVFVTEIFWFACKLHVGEPVAHGFHFRIVYLC